MAYSRDRHLRRQKTCLVLSILLFIIGILQLCFGILLSLKSYALTCHKVKYMMIGVYLVIAGICGIANYCPSKAHSPCKAKRPIRSRGITAVFIIFCVLITAVVIFDDSALNCVSDQGTYGEDVWTKIYTILAVVEVAGMHLAHLLSALCAGLACPDLWAQKNAWTHKPDKLLNSGSKNKYPKALHLPEARTHIQEATGTGDKVTVVSLPETDGIVYAVPEEQYVIRRGEATYIAPPGNTNLTAFFPTYRIQMD